jgi:hypothetical protein
LIYFGAPRPAVATYFSIAGNLKGLFSTVLIERLARLNALGLFEAMTLSTLLLRS